MATEGGIKEYRGGRKRTPFWKKKKAELTEGEKMFEALTKEIFKPRRRERAENK